MGYGEVSNKVRNPSYRIRTFSTSMLHGLPTEDWRNKKQPSSFDSCPRRDSNGNDDQQPRDPFSVQKHPDAGCCKLLYEALSHFSSPDPVHHALCL